MTLVSTATSPARPDYLERVYAAVLGKIIGVYLGRPFEGWTFERILNELGEIEYYVHDQLGVPLVVADDDITGTFTFLRALEERGAEFTSKNVGQTWLNAVIENRTIFWWGGYGLSTEHTAYLNLKNGIEAPMSGAVAQNGSTVAEQIGAQIFIDGWALVCPGDPERAADFAGRAARVSHDGEAVYAAKALAAMEARAFDTTDINDLLDTALQEVPADSLIARLIHDLRVLHRAEPNWRAARAFIAEHYGYDRFPGMCHVVPNHALILLALLYGGGDFQTSMRIVNTSGWDTDCNAGNLGCLLGIMHGLDAFEGGQDWRSPVADRLYLPTADGGRAVTDAAGVAVWVANLGRSLDHLPPLTFKNEARFHFELPGSLQGFQVRSGAAVTVGNVVGHSESGARSLRLNGILPGVVRVTSATFSPLEALAMNGRGSYEMIASPTLYPGQTIRARVEADPDNPTPVNAAMVIGYYGPDDQLVYQAGQFQRLQPGQSLELTWTVPDLNGFPIAEVGLELQAGGGAHAPGTLFLDWLTWSGSPKVIFGQPAGGGSMWRQAWVNAVDRFESGFGRPYQLIQNWGRGLISQGGHDWSAYRARAQLTPALSRAAGLTVRAQGLRRYYALLLVPGAVQLVKVADAETCLAQAPFEWAFGEAHTLELEADTDRLRGWVDGTLLFDVRDAEATLTWGGVGLVVEQGMLVADQVSVTGTPRGR